MCSQSKNDIMPDFEILRIRKVFYPKIFFCLFCPFFRKADNFIFFIYKEISIFLHGFTGYGIQFGKFVIALSSYKLPNKNITCRIKFRGFPALSGNDKWSSCFINQDRISFVNNCVVQSALNKLVLINCHIITQIIKTKLIICHICNVTCILFTTFIRIHLIQDTADCKPKEFMDLTHLFRITFC